ncbi:hypothetical protein BC2230_10758 [Burkholderia cepacia]
MPCSRRTDRRDGSGAQCGGGGTGDDPCLLARARRHAVHGRRRTASRQADRARAVRRADGTAGRRRAAVAGVRRADRCRCAVAGAAGRARARAGAGERLDRHGRRAGDRPGERRPQADARAARDDAPDEDGRTAARGRADGRAGRRDAVGGNDGGARCVRRGRGSGLPGRRRHSRRHDRFGDARQDGRQGCGERQADLCIDPRPRGVARARSTAARRSARRAETVRRTRSASRRTCRPGSEPGQLTRKPAAAHMLRCVQQNAGAFDFLQWNDDVRLAENHRRPGGLAPPRSSPTSTARG